LADRLARPRAVFPSTFVQPSSSSTGGSVVKWTERLGVETSGASAPAFSMVDGCGTSAMAAALARKFCACGTTTCRARGDRVVGEISTLASRALHTRSPSLLPRVLTHAAASWPAVPPTSDDASGLIVDWVSMTPGWLLFRLEPTGSKGWGAAGMVAGARITMAAGLVGWFCFVNG